MTPQEKEFMHRYLREDFLGQDGPAHQEANKIGFTYDHSTALWHPYKAVTKEEEWVEGFPPETDQPIPWSSREEVESRITALGSYL